MLIGTIAIFSIIFGIAVGVLASYFYWLDAQDNKLMPEFHSYPNFPRFKIQYWKDDIHKERTYIVQCWADAQEIIDDYKSQENVSIVATNYMVN